MPRETAAAMGHGTQGTIPTVINTSQHMWSETERFRSDAQKLVDDISKNSRNIYNQYDSSSDSKQDRFQKLLGMGVETATRFVKDHSNYERPGLQQEGTYLIQLKTNSIDNSHVIFGDLHPNGCVPLVLVPEPNLFRSYCIVPEGVTAIPTRWGKIIGTWEPGLHLMPPGTRAGFIVTKSHIPFDYPVKSVPTLDCVMVKIDVLIVFKVVDALKFILNLGPYKLTDLLSAFLEESIRSLARSVFYDQVYDLRGKSMEPMISSLREKLLEPFGIDVDDITITNIQIPKDLQVSMQDETSYISKHRCKQKNHEYDITCLLNKEQRHFAELDHENERKALDEESKRFRLLLSKECDEIEALTHKRLAEIRSEQVSDTLKLRLETEKEVATLHGKKDKLRLELLTMAQKRAAIISATADAYVKTVHGKTSYDVASNRAEVINTIAKVEAEHSEDLRALRAYMLRQKELEVLLSLSHNEDLVISGSSDYTQLAQIAEYRMDSHQLAKSRALKEAK